MYLRLNNILKGLSYNSTGVITRKEDIKTLYMNLKRIGHGMTEKESTGFDLITC